MLHRFLGYRLVQNNSSSCQGPSAMLTAMQAQREFHRQHPAKEVGRFDCSLLNVPHDAMRPYDAMLCVGR